MMQSFSSQGPDGLDEIEDTRVTTQYEISRLQLEQQRVIQLTEEQHYRDLREMIKTANNLALDLWNRRSEDRAANINLFADVNAKIDYIKQSTDRLDSLTGPAILVRAANTAALVVIIYLLLR